MSKFFSSFILLLFSALIAIFGLNLNESPKQVAAKDRVVVTKIVDGDTVDILDGSKTERVRLIGIDTPERGECFFHESAEYLEKLVLDKEVIIESDPTQENKDRYGRLLRYLYLPNQINIGEQMVVLGYAHEYTYNKPYKYQELYAASEAIARQNERGLYAGCGSQ